MAPLNRPHWMSNLPDLLRPYPKPYSAPDFQAESEAVARFFQSSWSLIVTVLSSIAVLILFLLILIRITSVYEKWNEKRGNEAIRVGRRELRLVRACERKGGEVRRRMEVERRERIRAETERRDLYRRDAVAERQRLGVGKKNKAQPATMAVIATVTAMPIEGESLGRSHSYSVATDAALERRPTLREMRRQDGTQIRSDSSEEFKRKVSVTARGPGGAEAQIGLLWRRGSKRSIHNATEPTTYFGVGIMRTARGHSSEPSRGTEGDDNNVAFSESSSSNPTPSNTIKRPGGGSSRRGEGSSGQMREFAKGVMEDAGFADVLLNREVGERRGFSFEVGREEIAVAEPVAVPLDVKGKEKEEYGEKKVDEKKDQERQG